MSDRSHGWGQSRGSKSLERSETGTKTHENLCLGEGFPGTGWGLPSRKALQSLGLLRRRAQEEGSGLLGFKGSPQSWNWKGKVVL